MAGFQFIANFKFLNSKWRREKHKLWMRSKRNNTLHGQKAIKLRNGIYLLGT